MPDNPAEESNSPEVLNTQQVIDLFAGDPVEFNPSQLQNIVDMLVSVDKNFKKKKDSLVLHTGRQRQQRVQCPSRPADQASPDIPGSSGQQASREKSKSIYKTTV